MRTGEERDRCMEIIVCPWASGHGRGARPARAAAPAPSVLTNYATQVVKGKIDVEIEIEIETGRALRGFAWKRDRMLSRCRGYRAATGAEVGECGGFCRAGGEAGS